MSSIYPTATTLENLPDELLLLICRYLSSIDILFSFYGLNFRLSTTITGFYRHVVLAEVSFNRFNYICKSILPNIGTNISSLVVSNDWKGVLSKTFLSYFGDKMSLAFPRLKHLTLIVMYIDSLTAFIDCLQNLTELFEISVHQLNTRSNSSSEKQTLLHRLLAANNSRLNSLICTHYSDPFSIDIQNNNVFFSNIEKLHINLKTINDLHELLTILPNLCYLQTQIYKQSFSFNEQHHYVSVSTLKYFHLRSSCYSWSFDQLASIIKRIPNVKELSIAIESSDDNRLLDGENFYSIFSTISVNTFHYFLGYHDSTYCIDHTKVLSTWKQFKQEFVCIKNNDKTILALYTLPFVFTDLILSSSLAKNEAFVESYAPHVKDLVLYDVSANIIDIFPVIKRCHRIDTLELRVDKNLVSQVSKQIQLSKLPYLIQVIALRKLSIDAEDFRRLLEVSPNLRHLEVNYEFLRTLFDDKSVHLLLEQRITHIYICISSPTSLESVISSMSQLTTIFPSLKHLYFCLENGYQSAESVILAVLNCLSKWKSLISFGAVDAVMTEETLSKDLRQWVIENSILDEHSSFVVGYISKTFRLWIQEQNKSHGVVIETFQKEKNQQEKEIDYYTNKMVLFCPIRSTLEQLPDEILLLICRYLSSTDVLFSFYGLNSRLLQTIGGYCRHVVLAEVPFMQFKYVCTSILPEIGANVYSLAVSNQWKGILSKLFINYFGEIMSLTFPNLRYLTFIAFSDKSLESFLNYLQNCPELHEINICQLSESANSPIDSKTLLHQIFTANNNQLNSILFDDQSIVFFVDNKNHDIFYSNINKLTIDLKTINDLHRLLTLLPQLISINVTLNKNSYKPDKLNENIPVITLKQFKLQSFGPLWNLNKIESIFKRIPNVEELSIAIESIDDIQLLDGKYFFPIFSILSLNNFNYFLRYYDSTHCIDHTKILSTWEQFKQEFVCIKSDDNKILALYTLPFVFSYLILPCSLAKNKVFIESYSTQAKDLTLCRVSTQIVDIFPIIQKCHRTHIIDLRIDEKVQPQIPKEIHLCKLSYLTKVTALHEFVVNAKYFQKLLEASPNLHHLEVSYDFLLPLFDDEFVGLLLNQRITHIYILIPLKTSLESVISSVSHLSSIFSSLKHFYFGLGKGYKSAESLISTVLKSLCKWNSLVSFGVVNAVLTEEILSTDIQQWVMENSSLEDRSTFIVDYTNGIFRLWL